MLSTDAAHLRHHFTIHVEPDPGALARLVEPFLVHDVLPDQLTAGTDVAGSYVVAVEFLGPADLARRIAGRIAAMPVVHRVVRDAVAR